MESTNKIGILFDLDGTLVNSLRDIAGSVNHLRRETGLPELDEATIRPHIGRGAEFLIKGCFPQVQERIPSLLLGRFNQIYCDYPSHGGELYPTVLETLQKLRKDSRVRLAIATNKPTEAALCTLRHYLPELNFDIVAGPELVSRKKPAPEHLTEVIGKMGLHPTQCFFVGDDQVDAQAAAAAQVRFFGASYGFGNLDGYDGAKIADLSELLTHIPHLGNANELC